MDTVGMSLHPKALDRFNCNRFRRADVFFHRSRTDNSNTELLFWFLKDLAFVVVVAVVSL